MKGADQVLAMPCVDRGLAADRGIDLRQQRSRHLHVIETAARHGGGEAREIADHAAAQRDDEVATLDAGGDQRLADGLEPAEALRALAFRDRDGRGGDPAAGKRGFGGGEMVPRDGRIGHDRSLGAGPQRSDLPAERSDQAAADHDLVAAVAKRNADGDWIG